MKSEILGNIAMDICHSFCLRSDCNTAHTADGKLHFMLISKRKILQEVKNIATRRINDLKET